MVALGAGDGAGAEALDGKAGLLEGIGHALDGGAAHGGVADDAALPHLFARSLELRLHEGEEAAALDQQLADGGQDGKHGGEAHVTDREVKGVGALGRRDVDDVGALEKLDARVLAKRPVELGVADVDGKHAGGTAAQQAVGEAAGGATHVNAGKASRVHAELVKAALELEAAAADIRKRAAHVQLAAGAHLGARRFVSH